MRLEPLEPVSPEGEANLEDLKRMPDTDCEVKPPDQSDLVIDSEIQPEERAFDLVEHGNTEASSAEEEKSAASENPYLRLGNWKLAYIMIPRIHREWWKRQVLDGVGSPCAN
ncbi:hypothetical protein Nepgr_003166 [Nepenthes gracilis]|uniref:Uncharacterized protein n=1 Tax=Nepenthes gracilis TaxID=150966 RepID=A0AAD3RZ08_NEPGR|nr:hypothetical protein Nepgr_003166 [Nepenthes gracilis]